MKITDIVKKHKCTTSFTDGEVPFINIDALQRFENVKAVFSTRIGGVSSGQFESMNFCTPLGDSKENVCKNFEIFLKSAGLKNIVLSKQTHTTNVRRVGMKDVGAGLYRPLSYDDVDGLITNEKEVTLSTFYADCVPLYFYDPINKAIGISHSGWKGTVNNIAKSTICAMNKEFGTQAKDLICGIGPSICVNCYEVGLDVANNFIEAYNILEIPDYSMCYNSKHNYPDGQNMDVILYMTHNDKYMLNLWAANYRNLENAGVNPQNIAIPDICTCENKEILFSHRGLMGKRGNLGAFLMLK